MSKTVYRRNEISGFCISNRSCTWDFLSLDTIETREDGSPQEESISGSELSVKANAHADGGNFISINLRSKECLTLAKLLNGIMCANAKSSEIKIATRATSSLAISIKTDDQGNAKATLFLNSKGKDSIHLPINNMDVVTLRLKVVEHLCRQYSSLPASLVVSQLGLSLPA